VVGYADRSGKKLIQFDSIYKFETISY